MKRLLLVSQHSVEELFFDSKLQPALWISLRLDNCDVPSQLVEFPLTQQTATLLLDLSSSFRHTASIGLIHTSQHTHYPHIWESDMISLHISRHSEDVVRWHGFILSRYYCSFPDIPDLNIRYWESIQLKYRAGGSLEYRHMPLSSYTYNNKLPPVNPVQ